MTLRKVLIPILSVLSLRVVGGTSSRFVVDTRDLETRIYSFDSPLCNGAYGSTGHAYFPANAPVSQQLTFKVEASEDVVSYEYVDGGESRTSSGNTHTINLASKRQGYSLAVIGVTRDGKKTAPFRANFDFVGCALTPYLTTGTIRQASDGRSVWSLNGNITCNLGKVDASPAVHMPMIGNCAGSPFSMEPHVKLDIAYDSSGRAEIYFGGGAGGDGGGRTYRKKKAKTFTGYGLLFDYNIGGHVSFAFNPASGNYELDGGASGLYGDVTGGGEYRIYWPGVPGLYVRGAASLSGEIDIGWAERRSGFYADGLLTVPHLELGAGWGSTKVKFDVGAKGSAEATLRFPGLNSFDLATATVAASAYCTVFWFEAEYEIWSGTWELYPNFGERRWSLSLPIFDGEDLSAFRPRERNPLRRLSARSGDDSADGCLLVPDLPKTGVTDTFQLGSRYLTAYVEDDAVRDTYNGQMLKSLSFGPDGSLPTAVAVWDDGTADCHPELKVSSVGTAFLAWVNAKRTYSSQDGLDAVLLGTEIAVAVKEPDADTWVSSNLTDNAVQDTMPSLAAADDGSAMIVWQRNDYPVYFANEDKRDSLVCSLFRNGSWSGEMSLPACPGAVLEGSLAWDGVRAVYVCAVDADFDMNTTDDLCICKYAYANGVWSDAEVLVVGADVRQPLVWFEGTDVGLVWRQGEEVFGQVGTGSGVRICVAPEYAPIFSPSGELMAIAVPASRVGHESEGSEICLVRWNPNEGIWGQPVAVTSDGRMKFGSSGAVGSDGQYRVTYRSLPSLRADEGDLRLVVKAPFADLAIPENGVILSGDEDWQVGSHVSVDVAVENHGLETAQATSVQLYRVDETDARELIGTQTLEPMASGERRIVGFDWTVASHSRVFELLAVVDESAMVEDADRSNNESRLDIFRPDLTVESVSAIERGEDEVVLKATVANIGASAAPAGAVVEFRLGSPTGTLIGSEALPAVPYGVDGRYAASCVWNGKTREATTDYVTVYAIICTDEAFDDADETNNQRLKVVKAVKEQGQVGSPQPQPENPRLPFETSVPVIGFSPTKPLTLTGYVIDGVSFIGTIQLKVASVKGKNAESKVTGSYIDLSGKKYSIRGVVSCPGTVASARLSVKGMPDLVLSALGQDGFCGSFGDWKVVTAVTEPVKQIATCQFKLEEGSLANVLEICFPNGLKVQRTDQSWKVVEKAGKVRLKKPNAKKNTPGVIELTGTNLSGLRLTYQPKSSTFKGSFKIWTLDPVKAKLKAVTASVTGIVVNGQGYGEVRVKKRKIGDFTVTDEQK